MFTLKPKKQEMLIPDQLYYVFLGNSNEAFKEGEKFEFRLPNSTPPGYLLCTDLLNLVTKKGVESNSRYARCYAGETFQTSHDINYFSASKIIQIVQVLEYNDIKRDLLEALNQVPSHVRKDLFLRAFATNIGEPNFIKQLFDLCYTEESRRNLDYKLLLATLISEPLAKELFSEYKEQKVSPQTWLANLAFILEYTPLESFATIVWDEFKELSPPIQILREIQQLSLHSSISKKVRDFALKSTTYV